MTFANYRYQVPKYNYPAMGFLYYASVNTDWFIMDDYGNAVRSIVEYDCDVE